MKNFLLCFFSLTLTYMVLEWVVFPWALVHLPLRLHPYLDEGVQPLAQSSKRRTLPEQYIVLVGDSYAKGYGDWLNDVGDSGNPAFHSAHVIAELSGIDVINFGRSGAGSLRGLLAEPLSKIHFVNHSGRFTLGKPRHLLVYFYEGNDLNNNLVELKRFIPKGAELVLQPKTFREIARERIVENHPIYQRAEHLSLPQRLFGARLVYNILTQELPRAQLKDWRPGRTNRVFNSDRVISIPDALQSPALELDGEQTELAIAVFEQALHMLMEFFPGTKTTVVYIPSPLASYQLASDTVHIETYQEGMAEHLADQVTRRSDELCERVRQVSEQKAEFLDSRAPLRKLAAIKLIHGPEDWRHFNQAGYTELGRIVAASLSQQGRSGLCAKLSRS